MNFFLSFILVIFPYLVYGENVKKVDEVKLSPKINVEDIDSLNTEIPLEDIRVFLKDYVLINDENEFNKHPNVKGQFSNRLLAHVGDYIYAENLPKDDLFFNLYTLGESYYDPFTGEKLGTEMVYNGAAKVENSSNISTLKVVRAVTGIDDRMKLIPDRGVSLPSRFANKRSEVTKDGYIIGMKGSLNSSGSYETVLINLGTRDNLKVGDNLDIVNIAYESFSGFKPPDSYAGKLLVFQTYEKISLAIIINSHSPIKLFDKVKVLF